ncbi:MAG TPA: ComEC/Rec2 family competence protein, partial [Micavibrio sp.]
MVREGEFEEFLGLSASRKIGWGERLGALIAAQKDRLFLFSPVCMGVGVCAYFGLRFEPPWVAVLAPLLILLPGIIYAGPRRLHSVGHYLSFLVLMALFLGCAGCVLAKLRTEIVASPVLQKAIKVTDVEGRVANIELLEAGDGWRLILKDLKIDRLAPAATPHSVRLKVRKADHVRPGDVVRIKAGINPPSAPVAPGAFDFQRHSYFKRIGGYGFAYGAPVVLQAAVPRDAPWLEHIRQKVAARISHVIPAREAGIANALMTGERAAISDRDNQDMRDSGIFHIISISGLHISMIAGVVFFAVRFLMALFPRFALYHPIKKYAAVIALIVTILYMLMVGATVPTVRAVIMTGIVLLAVMFDR